MRPQELVATIDAARWARVLAAVREHDLPLWRELEQAAMADQRIPPRLWQRYAAAERQQRVLRTVRAPATAPLAVGVLWSYLSHARQPLLEALRDGLGLPAPFDAVDGEPLPVPSDAQLDAALARLVAEFPFSDVLLCLQVLVALEKTPWPALTARLAEWEQAPPAGARPDEPAPTPAAAGQNAAPALAAVEPAAAGAAPPAEPPAMAPAPEQHGAPGPPAPARGPSRPLAGAPAEAAAPSPAPDRAAPRAEPSPPPAAPAPPAPAKAAPPPATRLMPTAKGASGRGQERGGAVRTVPPPASSAEPARGSAPGEPLVAPVPRGPAAGNGAIGSQPSGARQAAPATSGAAPKVTRAVSPAWQPAARRREPAPAQLTPLDLLLEDTIVATLTGAQGAPTEADLRAIVSEVLQLNAQRPQSSYHLGLLEVLGGAPLAIDRRGWSPSHLDWYHYGRLVGWTRQARWAAVARFYTDEREAAHHLLENPDELAPWAGPALFQGLRAADAPALAADLIRHFTGGLAPLAYCEELLAAANARLQEDRVAETLAVLEELRAVRPLAGEPAAEQAYQAGLRRAQAQCDQARGLFQTAQKALEAEVAQAEGVVRAELLGDLGLVAAGFRRLGEVRLPEAEKDPQAWLRNLELGAFYFLQAVELAPNGAATSSFCLGVLHWLQGQPEQARRYFEAALQAMQPQRALYARIGVYAQAQFYLGASLLLELDWPSRERALEYLRDALASGLRPATPTWRRLLDLVTLDPSLADPLFELFGAEGAAPPRELRLEFLVQCAPHSAAARRQLAHEARRRELPVLQRWELLTRLLAAQQAVGDHEGARDSLDALEGLAHAPSEHSRALLERWRDLLAVPERYQPAWSWEDALWSRVYTLELLGRDEEAFGLLETPFVYRLNDDTPEGLSEAESILARARGLASSPEAKDALQSMQRKLRLRQEAQRGELEGADDRIAAALHSGRSLRVLFVGGNETQARHEPLLRQALERRDPNTGAEISLRFIMPGFNSNWDKALDQVRIYQGRCDALVLMPFVRTELGRALRKLASEWDVPWLSCTGKGYDSMERALRTALDLAAQRLPSDRTGRR